MRKISLSEEKIDINDLKELTDWLLTVPRLTKGELTEQLEDIFAKYVGTKYSVYVNSGSSALLLMLASLVASGKLRKNSTILIPNVSWSTDVSSAMFAGLNVKFVDCNLEDLSVDLNELELEFLTGEIDALMLVSILGLVPNMAEITRLCDKYNVILLEDACESLGSEFEGARLGSFGLASVFSTYFAHHISTIEGGFICTSDQDLYNVMKSQRSHGWDRDLDKIYVERLRSKYSVSDFKAKFTFYYPSFNLRATDLQAFIGLGQMKKLDEINTIRNNNFVHYLKNMPNHIWKPENRNNGFVSSFAYPMIVDDRDRLVSALERGGVETRPLACGDMQVQPFVIESFPFMKHKSKNAERVDKHGLFIPNHSSVTFDDIEYICKIVKENT